MFREGKNERNVNSFKNSPLGLQLTYSSEFSIGQSIIETSLSFIKYEEQVLNKKYKEFALIRLNFEVSSSYLISITHEGTWFY